MSVKSMATYHAPEVLLICSNKNTMSNTAAVIKAIIELSLHSFAVIFQYPFRFCRGQIGLLNGSVIDRHYYPYILYVFKDDTNICHWI